MRQQVVLKPLAAGLASSSHGFIPRLDPAFLCLGSAALIRHGVRTLLHVSDAESPTTFQTASPSPANLCVARCSLPRLLP